MGCVQVRETRWRSQLAGTHLLGNTCGCVRWVCPNSTSGTLTPLGEESGPFPWGERKAEVFFCFVGVFPTDSSKLCVLVWVFFLIEMLGWWLIVWLSSTMKKIPNHVLKSPLREKAELFPSKKVRKRVLITDLKRPKLTPASTHELQSLNRLSDLNCSSGLGTFLILSQKNILLYFR